MFQERATKEVLSERAALLASLAERGTPTFDPQQVSSQAARPSPRVFAAAFLLAFFLGVPPGGGFMLKWLFSPAHFDKPTTFVIHERESLKSIAERLEHQGAIRSGAALLLAAVLNGKTRDMRAGTYMLSDSLPLAALLSEFSEGIQEAPDVWVMIPEGFTAAQIDARLARSGLIAQGEFQHASVDISLFPLIKSALPTPHSPLFTSELEGYLFPDTYRFSKGSSIQDIADKFLANFERKMTSELRAIVQTQGRPFHEVITLASLLEEEVRTTEDRRIVAGVLLKRREAGIPLQVDATILYAACHMPYAICDGKKKLLSGDLAIDSPYNTYKYKGLPPGPISNPGLESIEAALAPEPSPYWYYLSKPDGETVFSRTLEEHNRAKALYLR